ncbi:Bromodomain-containing_protein [Hexamita inflata]|uniref:Bromodomain-containing protein n=1 Tax=Hexamita inflata TaxID=28002 RepID=A0AA86Q8U3_9EUKA|nr:Bromodomain-containing protein [Hexamita inflata]CAI9948319.1 Bromodomain-containing protein [Hexamita inflata]CAI9953388.1 Bromodomain-containing protein [Hexamita inflata]CAI9954659.1 Bromodomain-containing protein [Hexamita inflata]
MADQAVRTGLTVITDQIRTQLIKVIDQTKKLRNYGSVFADPVDYISLGLNDYLEVIKRPMDLSTLRSNIMGAEYTYLHQFIKDADLIWSNCRVYNGVQSESFFLKAADECEKAFISLLCRIEQLQLTPEQHRIILQNPIPVISSDDEGPMSILQLHFLSKKLADLPREAQIQCVKWYYKQLGVNEDVDQYKDKDIRLVFKPSDSKVTRELDKLVTRKLDETRQLQKVTKV